MTATRTARTAFVLALSPANETDAPDFVPMSVEPLAHVAQTSTPRMPRTASPMNEIALLGAFCLALALSLKAVRKGRQ